MRIRRKVESLLSVGLRRVGRLDETVAAASVALYAVAIPRPSPKRRGQGGRQYAKDEKSKLYEAVVSGRTIAIFYSLEPFSPGKHKITSGQSSMGQLDRIAVDGKTLVGSGGMNVNLKKVFPRTYRTLRHVWRCARRCSAGDSAASIFFPVQAENSTAEDAYTLVYVSSDAKTVALEFRGGPACRFGRRD